MQQTRVDFITKFQFEIIEEMVSKNMLKKRTKRVIDFFIICIPICLLFNETLPEILVSTFYMKYPNTKWIKTVIFTSLIKPIQPSSDMNNRLQ